MQNKWLKSSVPGSDNLSLTIKSLLLSLVPFAMFYARAKGIDIAENQLVGYIEQFTAAIAAIGVIYGLGRKLFYWIKSQGIGMGPFKVA